MSRASRLAVAEPPLDALPEPSPQTPPARSTGGSHRRRRRLGAAIIVCVLVAAGIAGWAYRANSEPLASVDLHGPSDARRIVLSDGAITIGQVQHRLAKLAGADGLLASTADGAIKLDADLVVAAGATLRVDNAALMLRSDSARAVTIQVQGGGRLVIADSTIVSWDGAGVDTVIQDGRAAIVATGSGSNLEIRDSDLSYLGSGTDRPGISWRAGAGGSVIDSTLSHGFRGADARQAAALEISGATFSDNVDDGLWLESPARGTAIASSAFERNGGDGASISHATSLLLQRLSAASNVGAGVRVDISSSLTVADLQSHDNSADGLKLDDSVGSVVTGARSWSNLNGITVSGGSATVDGSTLSGNVTDGIIVLDAGASVTVRGAHLDHNARSGLWMAGASSATMTGSTVDRNGVGIRVDDASTISASGNMITQSVTDGVELPSPDAARVTGNTIADSGQAAFSLPAQADVSALVAANTLQGEQDQLRVRVEDGSS